MAVLHLAGKIYSAFIKLVIENVPQSDFHINPSIPHTWQWLIQNNYLEWCRAVLNSDWFEILPICSNGNAALSPIFAVTVLFIWSKLANFKLEAAGYILCKFIEHGLRIHQPQRCFPGKTAHRRKASWISQRRSFYEMGNWFHNWTFFFVVFF